MLRLRPELHYFFCVDTVSFRNRINGLSSYVRGVLGCDPLDGSVFVFMNSSRREVRMLHYTGNGYELYSRRLDPGVRYRRPVFRVSSGKFEVGWEELMLLLKGPVRRDMPMAGPFVDEEDGEEKK